MSIILNICILIVGLLQSYFFYLERFIWNTDKGLKIFKMTIEQARLGKIMAANQGVYNLLLGIALILSLFIKSEKTTSIQSFILLYIVSVGLYGAATVGKGIFFTQVMPSLITLIVLFIVITNPRINDIATSFNSKLHFTDKQDASKETIALQKKYYGYIQPLIIQGISQNIYTEIKEIINTKKSWKISKIDDSDKKLIIIYCSDQTSFLKFVDDIIITITNLENGFTQIDMRSRSRVGKSDFGTNAKRIDQFFKSIQKRSN